MEVLTDDVVSIFRSELDHLRKVKEETKQFAQRVEDVTHCLDEELAPSERRGLRTELLKALVAIYDALK